MAMLAQLVDGVVTYKFDLDKPSMAVGRLPDNDIIIDDASVSSKHAVIERIPNEDFPEEVEYFITDLGSTNGTEVNGQRIDQATKLKNNDEVKIAWNKFKFLDSNTVDMASTVHILK
ncbi:Glycogen accumulation regulator GarA [Thalassocella blandensis]|nr:Glycogen accumulation regulator GarA [Thalassocella blandensis]